MEHHGSSTSDATSYRSSMTITRNIATLKKVIIVLDGQCGC